MNTGVTIEPEWKEALGNYFESDDWKILSGFFTKAEYQKRNSISQAYRCIQGILADTIFTGAGGNTRTGSIPRCRSSTWTLFFCAERYACSTVTSEYLQRNRIHLGIKKDFTDGNLEHWAEQGVFLLNAILFVIANSPTSHQGCGWENFTDAVIKKISDEREHVVFMLWGNFASSKKNLIDTTKHLVLEASHPSPFSAYSGFFSCNHFSKCNIYLKINKKETNSMVEIYAFQIRVFVRY